MSLPILEAKYGLRCPNVFHAGDGNPPPLILFDASDPEQFRRTEAFAAEVLEKCVEVGGTITGEHGVGVAKKSFLPKFAGDAQMRVMRELRRVLDPAGILNPGKMFD